MPFLRRREGRACYRLVRVEPVLWIVVHCCFNGFRLRLFALIAKRAYMLTHHARRKYAQGRATPCSSWASGRHELCTRRSLPTCGRCAQGRGFIPIDTNSHCMLEWRWRIRKCFGQCATGHIQRENGAGHATALCQGERGRSSGACAPRGDSVVCRQRRRDVPA